MAYSYKRTQAQQVYADCNTVEQVMQHRDVAGLRAAPGFRPVLTYIFKDGSKLAVNPDLDEFYVPTEGMA